MTNRLTVPCLFVAVALSTASPSEAQPPGGPPKGGLPATAAAIVEHAADPEAHHTLFTATDALDVTNGIVDAHTADSVAHHEPGPTAYHVTAPNADLLGIDTIAALILPAGSYFVTAQFGFKSVDASGELDCAIHGGPLYQQTVDSGPLYPVTIIRLVTLAAADAVLLECAGPIVTAGDDPPNVFNVQFTALSLNAVIQ